MGRGEWGPRLTRLSHARAPSVVLAVQFRHTRLAATCDLQLCRPIRACSTRSNWRRFAGITELLVEDVSRMALQGPALRSPAACCLTVARADTHRQATLAARRSLSIIRLAAKAPYRRGPLSSNVRRHNRTHPRSGDLV